MIHPPRPSRPINLVRLASPEAEFDRALKTIRPYVEMLKASNLGWREDGSSWSSPAGLYGGDIYVASFRSGYATLSYRATAISGVKTLLTVPVHTSVRDPNEYATHICEVFDYLETAPREPVRPHSLHTWMIAAIALRSNPADLVDTVELATPWSVTRLEGPKPLKYIPIAQERLDSLDKAMPMTIIAKCEISDEQWRINVSSSYGFPHNEGWHPDHNPMIAMRALKGVAAAGVIIGNKP